ncbi:MAG TPA: DUF1801 domain-containing protein [Vicinamibacterales bacterium]
MTPPRELLTMLRRHDSELRTLMLRLRELVISTIAPCHEFIYSMKWKVVLFYGATERVMDDGICAIVVYKKVINLAFPRGVDLNDPTAALAGSGIGWRHISIRTRDDLEKPAIADLLGQARENAAGPRRRRRRGEPDVVTRVRASSRPAGSEVTRPSASAGSRRRGGST